VKLSVIIPAYDEIVLIQDADFDCDPMDYADPPSHRLKTLTFFGNMWWEGCV